MNISYFIFSTYVIYREHQIIKPYQRIKSTFLSALVIERLESTNTSIYSPPNRLAVPHVCKQWLELFLFHAALISNVFLKIYKLMTSKRNKLALPPCFLLSLHPLLSLKVTPPSAPSLVVPVPLSAVTTAQWSESLLFVSCHYSISPVYLVVLRLYMYHSDL